MEQQYFKWLKAAARFALLAIMALLVLSMILGTGHLFAEFFAQMISPDPYKFLIRVEDLYLIFSTLLIVVVGYELFKSLYLILNKEVIPVRSILKIAAIAIANKVITADIKHMDYMSLFAVAVIMLATGGTYYLFSRDKGDPEL